MNTQTISDLVSLYNRESDQKIRNRIAEIVIGFNSGFYVKFAMRIPDRSRNWKDFMQLAKITTLKAMASYQREKGSFSTHLSWQLKSTVTLFAQKSSNVIKPNTQWYYKKRQGKDEPGDWPVHFKIEDNPHLSIEPTINFEARDAKKRTDLITQGLTKFEREVIEKRFALKGGDPLTLQEIADQRGLSRERIRQIEVIAFKKIKAYLTNHFTDPACREMRAEYVN